MFDRHRHFLDRTYLCSAEGDEASLGPGGVATPTPEPGPTPTPQLDPEPSPEPLKPVAALLGKEAPKEGDEPAKPEPKTGAEARINGLTREKWEEKRRADAAEARAKLAEDTIATAEAGREGARAKR